MAKRMLSPYMSKTFLSILAILNKTDFCTIPTFNLTPSVSTHPLKPLLMHPRAPATTGTTLTFFSDQNLSRSLQIRIFFNLFDFFLTYPTITWYSNIDDDAWFRLFVFSSPKSESHSFFLIALSWSHNRCYVISKTSCSFHSCIILCLYHVIVLPSSSKDLLLIHNKLIHVLRPLCSDSSRMTIYAVIFRILIWHFTHKRSTEF